MIGLNPTCSAFGSDFKYSPYLTSENRFFFLFSLSLEVRVRVRVQVSIAGQRLQSASQVHCICICSTVHAHPTCDQCRTSLLRRFEADTVAHMGKHVAHPEPGNEGVRDQSISLFPQDAHQDQSVLLMFNVHQFSQFSQFGQFGQFGGMKS